MDRLLSEGYAKQNNGKFEVNLTKAGYDKLLGDGRIGADRPLRILVGKSSEKGIAKIGETGGEVILPSKGKEE
jgi:ribosomal protein L15